MPSETSGNMLAICISRFCLNSLTNFKRKNILVSLEIINFNKKLEMYEMILRIKLHSLSDVSFSMAFAKITAN